MLYRRIRPELSKELASKLKSSASTRRTWVGSKLNVLIPSQIRALRLRRNLSQKQLADLCGMKQSRISMMETPGANLSIQTLVRIAAALGIGLQVNFASFQELLDWENAYSQDSFDVEKLR